MTSFWLLLATIVLGLLIYLIYSSTSKEPAKIGGEEVSKLARCKLIYRTSALLFWHRVKAKNNIKK